MLIKRKLKEVYLTDLIPLDCVIMLKSKPKREYFSRTYEEGILIYGKDEFPVECISFASGNIQILSIEGNEEKVENIVNIIHNRQSKRRLPLMIREFIKYLYILISFGMGVITTSCLLTWNISGFFKGFLIILSLRLLYSESRNKLK